MIYCHINQVYLKRFETVKEENPPPTPSGRGRRNSGAATLAALRRSPPRHIRAATGSLTPRRRRGRRQRLKVPFRQVRPPPAPPRGGERRAPVWAPPCRSSNKPNYKCIQKKVILDNCPPPCGSAARGVAITRARKGLSPPRTPRLQNIFFV